MGCRIIYPTPRDRTTYRSGRGPDTHKEKCRIPPAGVWGVPSFLPIIPQEWGIEGVEKSLFITLYHGARL